MEIDFDPKTVEELIEIGHYEPSNSLIGLVKFKPKGTATSGE